MKHVDPNIEAAHIVAPASKSHAQRLILAAALCSKPTEIIRIGNSADVMAMLNASTDLGCEFDDTDNGIIIRPGGEYSSIIECGESGLGIRLLSSICAVLPFDFELRAHGSLTSRPMTPVKGFLEALGVQCELNGEYAPIKIYGSAKPGEINLPETNSSQYLSGLLMALPTLDGDSVINNKSSKSKPYVELTLEVLGKFGIKIETDDYSKFVINGNQKYISPGSIKTEGDWSGAANWIVLGAIQGGIHLYGLHRESLQADKAILNAIESTGATYNWRGDDLIIEKGELKPFEFDATQCPDLFPPLVALAAACKGTSTIKGVNRLIHKESNRANALKSEFGKLGLQIEVDDDLMMIHGEGSLESGTVDSVNDHRIAMSCAIAAVLTERGVSVENPEAVAKSYPEFWEALKQKY